MVVERELMKKKKEGKRRATAVREAEQSCSSSLKDGEAITAEAKHGGPKAVIRGKRIRRGMDCFGSEGERKGRLIERIGGEDASPRLCLPPSLRSLTSFTSPEPKENSQSISYLKLETPIQILLQVVPHPHRQQGFSIRSFDVS